MSYDSSEDRIWVRLNDNSNMHYNKAGYPADEHEEGNVLWGMVDRRCSKQFRVLYVNSDNSKVWTLGVPAANPGLFDQLVSAYKNFDKYEELLVCIENGYIISWDCKVRKPYNYNYYDAPNYSGISNYGIF